jgi:hypothetical protein
MITITKLTQIPKSFNSAIGWYYYMELSNGDITTTCDDELIEWFGCYKSVNDLIGKEWVKATLTLFPLMITANQ